MAPYVSARTSTERLQRSVPPNEQVISQAPCEVSKKPYAPPTVAVDWKPALNASVKDTSPDQVKFIEAVELLCPYARTRLFAGIVTLTVRLDALAEPDPAKSECDAEDTSFTIKH